HLADVFCQAPGAFDVAGIERGCGLREGLRRVRGAPQADLGNDVTGANDLVSRKGDRGECSPLSAELRLDRAEGVSGALVGRRRTLWDLEPQLVGPLLDLGAQGEEPVGHPDRLLGLVEVPGRYR